MFKLINEFCRIQSNNKKKISINKNEFGLMGLMVEAQCPCGYTSGTLFVGCGYFDSPTLNKEPAYCPQCKRLVLRNYSKLRQKCRKCSTILLWYNDPQMYRKKDEPHTDQFSGCDDFLLPDALFLCPNCGNMTMKFICTGCWD